MRTGALPRCLYRGPSQDIPYPARPNTYPWRDPIYLQENQRCSRLLSLLCDFRDHICPNGWAISSLSFVFHSYEGYYICPGELLFRSYTIISVMCCGGGKSTISTLGQPSLCGHTSFGSFAAKNVLAYYHWLWLIIRKIVRNFLLISYVVINELFRVYW